MIEHLMDCMTQAPDNFSLGTSKREIPIKIVDKRIIKN